MTTTTKLGLELLASAAANQILSNTTFAMLNQLVQAAATDRLNTPPGSPADEALYIITATATGAWAGKENQLAYWLDSTGAWQYIAPREGMLVHVNDENVYYKYDGSAWASFSAGGTFTGGTLTSALNEAPATTLASASTVDVGAELANTVIISGTTTITSLGTIASGAVRRLEFQGILTLTHNGTSLILPTGANITTAAGDVAEFRSLGSGNWRCVAYTRANGQALAAPGGGYTVVPAFSAWASAATSLTAGTLVKVGFQTEEYDTGANFSGSTFTAPVGGIYFFTAAVALATATANVILAFYKNGVIAKRHSTVGVGSWGGSAYIKLAAGDTVELFFRQDASTQNCVTDQAFTFFQGALVART